jgi:hypothetical protein
MPKIDIPLFEIFYFGIITRIRAGFKIDINSRLFSFGLYELLMRYFKFFQRILTHSGMEQEYNNIAIPDIFIIVVLQTGFRHGTGKIFPCPVIKHDIFVAIVLVFAVKKNIKKRFVAVKFGG